MDNENMLTIMGLIANSGNARSLAMQAIYAAKKGNFDEADEKLKESRDSLTEAHHSQTELLTKEANGEKTEISILLIHAQDHLMNGITVRDLAEEIVDIYKNK